MDLASSSRLVEQLRWRYAVKKFDPGRMIAPAVWEALEASLVLTASSFGLQPWRFVVVTDTAVRARLAEASWRQSQPIDCSHFVVMARRHDLQDVDIDRYLDQVALVQSVPRDSLLRYRDVIVRFRSRAEDEGWLNTWADRQVYIALGSFLTACAVLEVDTCPMEGIVPEKYDEILGLREAGYATVVACAAGYRAADDRHAALPKVRYEADSVIQRV